MLIYPQNYPQVNIKNVDNVGIVNFMDNFIHIINNEKRLKNRHL